MILSQIRDYMALRGRASIGDMANHFDADMDAVRGMLDIWMRKGRVRRIESTDECGGCSKCDPLKLEIYEWIS
ncbi:MAG: FeoC-like transcriptional regulator [Rhodospirillales bacterium]|nr:FeoC-like transcriptional regulator [Rhodospirillales bacterium]MCW8952981.1 FeoC-like transcriptional regulator [Rhodospirillales bacterium]MCW8970635.1 FeoC-like transcriptional regulator [Rhodospirillales bacterium]MCW9002335.1 FeoC-like transcriptional regulator [Rhodospirillales bacterium]